MVKCAYCLEEIKGGAYIEREGKKIYFGSSECLDKFKEEKNEK